MYLPSKFCLTISAHNKQYLRNYANTTITIADTSSLLFSTFVLNYPIIPSLKPNILKIKDDQHKLHRHTNINSA